MGKASAFAVYGVLSITSMDMRSTANFYQDGTTQRWRNKLDLVERSAEQENTTYS